MRVGWTFSAFTIDRVIAELGANAGSLGATQLVAVFIGFDRNLHFSRRTASHQLITSGDKPGQLEIGGLRRKEPWGGVVSNGRGGSCAFTQGLFFNQQVEFVERAAGTAQYGTVLRVDISLFNPIVIVP